MKLKVLVAVLVLLLAACGGKQEREAKYIERGKTLFAQGDLVKAQLEFRNALQINPKGVDAQYHLMLIAEQQGAWKEAYQRALAVTQQDPNHRAARIKLGHFYLLGNDVEKAKGELEAAAKLGAEDAELATLRATIALREGRLADAIGAAEAALAKDPSHLGAMMMLAAARERAGQTDAALATLASAIERYPADVALRLQRSRINLALGRFDDAVADYRALIDKQPDAFGYRLALAQLYAGRDRLDEAEAVLRQALTDKVGGIEARTALIDLLAQRRGFDAADGELQQLIAAEPNEYALQFKRADLLFSNKRPDEAEAVLTAIVQKDGTGASGVNARVALARAALTRDDRPRAEALITEVLSADAGNTDALLIRGTLALGKGNMEAAVADARTVLRTAPRSTAALRLLANAQLLRNEPDLAMDSLGQLIEIDPNDLVAREQLAGLQARRGNLDRALALYDGVLAIQPKRPTSLVPKAEVLMALQRWAAAENAIRAVLDLPDQELTGRILYGKFHQVRGQTNDALRSFERALVLQPQSPEALTGIVQSYAAAKRTAEAIPFLERVTRAAPDNAFAWNLLGEVQGQQKATGPAEEAFRRAMALQSAWPVPYANLSAMQLAAGQGAAAVATLNEGVERTNADIRLLFGLADAQERTNDAAGAIASYDRILQASPDSDVAANNYAALVADYSYLDSGRLARALELAKRFETSENPLFLDTLGWILYRKGDFQQARIYLERAVVARGDIPVIHYHLGMALNRLGDRSGARAALEKSLAGQNNFTGREEAEKTLKSLTGA